MRCRLTVPKYLIAAPNGFRGGRANAKCHICCAKIDNRHSAFQKENRHARYQFRWLGQSIRPWGVWSALDDDHATFQVATADLVTTLVSNHSDPRGRRPPARQQRTIAVAAGMMTALGVSAALAQCFSGPAGTLGTSACDVAASGVAATAAGFIAKATGTGATAYGAGANATGTQLLDSIQSQFSLAAPSCVPP